jgi:glutamine amidotransferase PdxT
MLNCEIYFNSLGSFQVPIASLKDNLLAASHQITQSLAVLRKKIKLRQLDSLVVKDGETTNLVGLLSNLLC